MPRSSWIKVFETAVQSEGVFGDDPRAVLVPQQFYACNSQELAIDIRSFLGEAIDAPDFQLVCFCDGVFKETSEEHRGVDEVVREALTAQGIVVRWIDVTTHLGIPGEDLHASYHHLDDLRPLVRRREPTAYLVLGSGTLTDLIKHTLFLEENRSPFLSVPTAMTVTAFTSSFAVLDFSGAKRTKLSRTLSATFWMESVLKCAPARLSRAGLGDLLARFVAYGDWYLGWRMGLADSYDEIGFRLMEPFIDGLYTSSSHFSKWPLAWQAVECVSMTLAMAGVAMSVCGSTTPLSGFEHVISHGLDYLGLMGHQPCALHGEQVAVATLASSLCFEYVIAHGDSLLRQMQLLPWIDASRILESRLHVAPYERNEHSAENWHPLGLNSELRERVQAAAKEFLVEYRIKHERISSGIERARQLALDWPEARLQLQRLTLPSARLVELVRAGGLPLCPQDVEPPILQNSWEWALGFSPFIRSRFCIADLLFWSGESTVTLVMRRGSLLHHQN